jgi:phage gpG-like protein
VPVFSLEIDVGGVRRTFTSFVENMRDLDPALQAFGRYLLKKWRKPKSFAPLAAATIAHRESSQAAATEAIRKIQLGRLRKKLVREMRRAKAKSSGAAVAQRYAVLKEFDRIVGGGGAGVSLLSGPDGAKASKSLRGRIERAGGKSSSKILGRLPAANKMQVKSGALTAGSTVDWAHAHNEGLSVGKGAKLPQRTYVTVEEEDMNVLVNLVVDYIFWSRAGGGVSAKFALIRS